MTTSSAFLIGPRGAVAASRTVTGGVISIHPNLPLDLLAKFEFGLGNTLISAKGGSFAGSTSSFTTQDGDWQRPYFVASYSPRNALYSQVSVNDAGDTAVVWVQSDDSQYTVWVNQFDGRTRTWSTAYRLDASNGESLYPSVTIDINGNIIAAWRQREGNQASIVVRTFSAVSQSWSAPKSISTDSKFPDSMGMPKVDVDRRGIAMIAWTQASGLFACESSGDIVANAWRLPVSVAAAGEQKIDLKLARNSSGDAILSMKAGEHIYATLYSAKKGEWTGLTKISQVGDNPPQPTFDAFGKAVAVQVVPSIDSLGNSYVVWSQFDGHRGNVWFNRFDANTKTWALASLLDPSAVTETYHPSVAALPFGGAVAVWRKYDGQRFNIWGKQYDGATGTWSAAVEIENAPGNTQYPSVSSDASGNAIAAWLQYDGTRITVWANRFNNITSTWGNANQIELSAADPAGVNGESMAPQVSVGPSGRSAVVWVRSSGTANIPALVAAALFN